jgi:hypothetical protein
MDLNFLKGKTIEKFVKFSHIEFDDKGYLGIVFTDATEILIVSTYGDWTGYSLGEYPTDIRVIDVTGDLNENACKNLELLL